MSKVRKSISEQHVRRLHELQDDHYEMVTGCSFSSHTGTAEKQSIQNLTDNRIFVVVLSMIINSFCQFLCHHVILSVHTLRKFTGADLWW